MKPVHVFVSYSHLDGRWVESGKYDLVPWLVRSLRREDVTFWCDPALNEAAGVKWRDVIKGQIDGAQIALLLISQNFLNSDFIRDVELP